MAKTKLTNPDEWIIKIKRELSETTFFKGKEIIDKISQRQEKLERNKENPIIKAAIAKELLKRSKEEKKVHQEPLEEISPDTSKDEQGKNVFMYFMVPNNRAACLIIFQNLYPPTRLLIFKVFVPPTRLFGTL